MLKFLFDDLFLKLNLGKKFDLEYQFDWVHQKKKIIDYKKHQEQLEKKQKEMKEKKAKLKK